VATSETDIKDTGQEEHITVSDFFPEHPDYWQLLSGAHRKPATVISTPCIVRHLGFWYRSDRADEANSPTRLAQHVRQSRTSDNRIRAEWKADVDNYICALYFLLLGKAEDKAADIREFRCTNTYTFSDKEYILLFSRAIDCSNRELITIDTSKEEIDDVLEGAGPEFIQKYFDADYKAIVFRF